MARIELGKTYRCTVTGFTGVATGRTEFLGGNERAMLQARAMPDGVPTKPVWIEAPQLVEVAGPALTPTKQAAAAPTKAAAATAPAKAAAATDTWPPDGTRPFRSN